MSIEATTFLFKELSRITGMPDPTAPYVTRSVTSKEAAEAIRPKVNALQAKVFDAIYSKGLFGATDSEIQDALKMEGSTERPRRRELEIMGKIVNSGTSRKQENGRNATVWIATELANV